MSEGGLAITKYRLRITVKEIKGKCPLYQVGDTMIIDKFYLDTAESENFCIHAISAMFPLLSSFIHGISAKELGIGTEKDIGYLQCPDPGPPHTKGGTVLFEIKREVNK